MEEYSNQIDQCSLYKVKKIVNDSYSNETKENKEEIQRFYSTLKNELLKNNLVIDDVQNHSEQTKLINERKQKVKELKIQAEKNRNKITETINSIMKKIENTIQIENAIGADELTQNDAMMLEEALEMIKYIVEINNKSIDELEKIKLIYQLGENVHRNSCSLIQNNFKMEMN